MVKDKPLSVKDAVHKLQLSLLEGVRHETQLFAAGSLMSRSDYEDVVIERTISNVCGYPLCNNSLPSDRPRKGRYRISLKEHKVYDLQETYLYCSTSCVVNSRAFAESLQPERCDVSNPEKINEVLNLFGKLNLDDNVLQKKGDIGFSDLKIEEKLDVKMTQMSLEDWIGPSNAIEGYVPLIDRNTKLSSPKHHKKVSKHKSAGPKTDKGKLVDDLDFTSTIIVGDKSSHPKLSSDPKLKDYISRLEELERDQLVDLEAFSIPKENGLGLSTLAGETQFGIPEMFYDSAENLSNKDAKESENKVSVEKMGYDSVSNRDAKETKKEVLVDRMVYHSSSNRYAKESKKEVFAEKMSVSNGGRLRPSLKSSGAKKLTRSVTWADEGKTGSLCTGKLSEVREMSDTQETAGVKDEEDDDASLFLASAQACALALSQASEAVASGEVDVSDAVSKAGIVILPQPEENDKYFEKDEDMVETNLVPLKWPKKPGGLNAEIFDTEDSWYDPPPEGFSLTLSSFATMYMALFGWITSSSLAYIYGQDDHSHEEFLFVNGREYSHKIVLSDGRSSEIKLTLAGCLSRALPKVATDLRLKTPVFTIEKEVGHLLNTMSFLDALPSFKLKQWHVICLLFVDALSVCRIPGLAPHMTSGRILLQKVLDGAQVSGEEYEIMKDHLIPLGRVPQFSAQSGA